MISVASSERTPSAPRKAGYAIPGRAKIRTGIRPRQQVATRDMDGAQKPVTAPHDRDDHHAEREKHPEQVPEIETFPNPLGSFCLCFRHSLPPISAIRHGMRFSRGFPVLIPRLNGVSVGKVDFVIVAPGARVHCNSCQRDGTRIDGWVAHQGWTSRFWGV